jgi:predicted enzyme related to lactoylglutathione lyase
MNMTKPIGIFKGVIVDTQSLATLMPFYEAVFGPPKFVDGDRWAAMGSVGAAALNLAAGSERTGKGIVFAVKVDDITAATRQIIAAGGQQLGEPKAGAHEIRCFFSDPDGHALAIYQAL